MSRRPGGNYLGARSPAAGRNRIRSGGGRGGRRRRLIDRRPLIGRSDRPDRTGSGRPRARRRKYRFRLRAGRLINHGRRGAGERVGGGLLFCATRSRAADRRPEASRGRLGGGGPAAATVTAQIILLAALNAHNRPGGGNRGQLEQNHFSAAAHRLRRRRKLDMSAARQTQIQIIRRLWAPARATGRRGRRRRARPEVACQRAP